MGHVGKFDPTFDFRTDAGGGDPDQNSPTLRAYHKALWSKPLPGDDPFDLDDITSPYLHHVSSRGEFYLTSDAAMPTWTARRPQLTEAVSLIDKSEREQFDTVTYQMGGMMLFPGKHWTTTSNEDDKPGRVRPPTAAR
jgi:hypothetical protein